MDENRMLAKASCFYPGEIERSLGIAVVGR
jgi:hypothetical protein